MKPENGNTPDSKRSRAHLKSLFRAGSMPTDADFKKLIDSSVNRADDKFERRNDGTQGDSICIGAGANQLLMSFFATLDNAGSDWSLQLTGSRGLNFNTGNQGRTVLHLNPAGRVGVNTDHPATELDVNGSMQADNLNLKGRLDVQGALSAGSLTLPGIGTISDTESLRRIIQNLLPPGPPPQRPTSSIPWPAREIPAPVSPVSPVSPAPPEPPPFTPAPEPQQPDEQHNAADAGQPEGEAPVHTVQGTVPAGRQWQQIAGPLTGMHALQVLAWVTWQGHKSICHATAVNIDGDPSSGAITVTSSYKGRPGARVDFRWRGNAEGYFLECRTRLRMPSLVDISYKIDYLI